MALRDEAPFICSEGPPGVQSHSFASTQSASRATGELRLLSYARLPTPLFLENNTFHIRYHLGQVVCNLLENGWNRMAKLYRHNAFKFDPKAIDLWTTWCD
jgi:hypothetical protein